jgi:hypothetical protein
MYDTGGVCIRMSMRKIINKIFVGTLKMISNVFSGGKYLEKYRWNICAVFLERT